MLQKWEIEFLKYIAETRCTYVPNHEILCHICEYFADKGLLERSGYLVSQAGIAEINRSEQQASAPRERF